MPVPQTGGMPADHAPDPASAAEEAVVASGPTGAQQVEPRLGQPTGGPAPFRSRREGSGTTWLRDEALIAGRLLVLGAAVTAGVWLALRVQVVTAGVILGFAEVAMLWPLARWLRRQGVPAVLAALVCVAGFSSLFLLLLGFVVLRLVAAWPELVAAFTGGLERLDQWLATGPVGVDTATLQAWGEQLQASLATVLSQVGTAATAVLGAVTSIGTILVVATFFAIFTLTSGDAQWARFLKALAPRVREPADAALRSAMRTAGNWFYASTVTGLVDGLFIGIGLYLLGVPLAVPIGALTFVLGYVTLIGATLAGALAVLVALIAGGPVTALWALVIVLAVQQIEGNVLSPLLLSKAVRFHPAVTLVLTTGAAVAFGLVGLFLAVPVAGMVVAAVAGWRSARTPSAEPVG